MREAILPGFFCGFSFNSTGNLVWGWCAGVVALFRQPVCVVVQIAIKECTAPIRNQIEGVGGGTQQVAVMRHQHHGGIGFLQGQRERFPHFQVEMVGGFVQQQQIRPLPDQQRQSQARGHVLLEGDVGVGKTTLLRAFTRGIGGGYERVEGTIDLIEALRLSQRITRHRRRRQIRFASAPEYGAAACCAFPMRSACATADADHHGYAIVALTRHSDMSGAAMFSSSGAL